MTITVYTTPLCMGCKMTAKHLDKSGIPYRKIDVTQDPDAAVHVAQLGYTTAPVITVTLPDGLDHWHGYRPDRLDALTYLSKGA